MIFWLSLGLAGLGYLAGAGALLTDAGLDPATVKKLIAVTTLLVGLGNTVLAAMSKPEVVTHVLTKLNII